MTESNSLLNARRTQGEIGADMRVRPEQLDQYIGQETVCEQMRVFIEAARGRQVTALTWRYFNLDPPDDHAAPSPPSLF